MKKTPKPKSYNLNLDPIRTPVLYADSVYIKSSKNGLVLDFAQQVGTTDQFNVVSRVGLSKEHAHDLIDHLEALLRVEGVGNTQKSE